MFARKLFVGCLALVILARAVHCLYVDAGLCALAADTQGESRPLSDPTATDPNESGCLCKGALIIAPCLPADLLSESHWASLAAIDLTPAYATVARLEQTAHPRVCPPPLSAREVRADRLLADLNCSLTLWRWWLLFAETCAHGARLVGSFLTPWRATVMVPFAAKRLRDGLVVVGVAAVLVALLALMVMRSHPTTDEQAETPDKSAADTNAEPAEVRLSRPELPAAAGIEIEPVQSRSLENAITCNGSVGFNLNKYVKVPPKAEGVLAKINVDVGATIRAGDVLAVVNSQVVGDLKASYLKAIVHEEHLRWQIEKFKSVADGIAAKNLFEVQHLLEEELTDTARIRDRLGVYGFSATQIKQFSEDKNMSVELPVVAPRDGVVVLRQAVEGEPASTQSPLFAIADLDTMWVHLHVYESHLPHIRLGQVVTFFPDGLPGQGFDGTLTWVSPEVDARTRTIQLRAEVVNRDRALRANMFGKGKLPLEQPLVRLVVPPTAVQSHHGNHIVFVQKPDNLFEVRQIEVGLKGEEFWEVTSGLKSGERVATVGSFLLKSNLENPEFGKVE